MPGGGGGFVPNQILFSRQGGHVKFFQPGINLAVQDAVTFLPYLI